ncbi:MAG: type IV pilus secretin PilQ [Bdellovibrionia bacterium]
MKWGLKEVCMMVERRWMSLRALRILGAVLLSGGVPKLWAVTNIVSLNFDASLNPQELVIDADGPIDAQKQISQADRQVILEIKEAPLEGSATQAIDTTALSPNLSRISPYPMEGQATGVRIALQFKALPDVELLPSGNRLRVLIYPSLGDDDPSKKANRSYLDEFIENKENQKFTGKPVTLQLRDVEVQDVLRLIGEASGFNVIIGDDVKGKITLSLVDVPWDQALDVVLHTLHLGAERSNNILRVSTLANLTAEKTAELQAIKAAKAAMPLVTRVFPISYARLPDLQALLSKFIGSQPSEGGIPGLSDTPIVQIDDRTNSIVVHDSVEKLEKVKKLIEALDTQTPQVMIEAKVVEATEGFTQSLTGSLGFGSSGETSGFASFAGGNPLDPLLGTGGVYATGAAISNGTGAASSRNGSFGLSPTLSFLPGMARLNAVLSWGESENQLKVVSSPKTVVLNKESSSIVQSTPVLVPTTTTAQTGQVIPATTIAQANISLDVRPTVTNDGSVLMELTVSKDVPVALVGGNAVGNRNIKTTVLVESGSTLVIGGIYTMETNRTSSGFPILRKLPLIGALFGDESDNTSRSELFIFITPKILNVKESGLG